MPKSLEEALKRHYLNQRRKGRLQDVDIDQYVYGAKDMKDWGKKRKVKQRLRSERE